MQNSFRIRFGALCGNRTELFSLDFAASSSGSEDRIFPVANMVAYWTEKWNGEVLRLPLPHYPFGDTSLMYNYLQTI